MSGMRCTSTQSANLGTLAMGVTQKLSDLASSCLGTLALKAAQAARWGR